MLQFCIRSNSGTSVVVPQSLITHVIRTKSFCIPTYHGNRSVYTNYRSLFSDHQCRLFCSAKESTIDPVQARRQRALASDDVFQELLGVQTKNLPPIQPLPPKPQPESSKSPITSSLDSTESKEAIEEMLEIFQNEDMMKEMKNLDNKVPKGQEKRVSLEEYAKTLTGGEKLEFVAWLSTKQRQLEDEEDKAAKYFQQIVEMERDKPKLQRLSSKPIQESQSATVEAKSTNIAHSESDSDAENVGYSTDDDPLTVGDLQHTDFETIEQQFESAHAKNSNRTNNFNTARRSYCTFNRGGSNTNNNNNRDNGLASGFRLPADHASFPIPVSRTSDAKVLIKQQEKKTVNVLTEGPVPAGRTVNPKFLAHFVDKQTGEEQLPNQRNTRLDAHIIEIETAKRQEAKREKRKRQLEAKRDELRKQILSSTGEHKEDEELDDFIGAFDDDNLLSLSVEEIRKRKERFLNPKLAIAHTPDEKLKLDLAEYEKQQEIVLMRQRKRAAARSKRVMLSIGTVSIPQSLKDRVTHLIRKFNSKKLRGNPVILPGVLGEEQQNKTMSIRNMERFGDVSHPNDDLLLPTQHEMAQVRIDALKPNTSIEALDAKKYSESKFVPIVFGRPETLYYLQHFMPSQYAITYKILSELETIVPTFVPRLVLDFGSGTGTTLFAADQVWGEGIVKHFMAIEPSTAMLDAAQVLNKNDTRAVYRRYLSLGRETSDFDLVVSTSTYTHLRTHRDRRDTTKSLWRSVAPGGYFVFAELGTPVGYHLMNQVRNDILGEDIPGEIIAPCPHSLTCQMAENSWCHFKQRVNLLPHEQTRTKTGDLKSFRDISYSYVVFRKPHLLPTEKNALSLDVKKGYSRIVRRPRKRGGHVYLTLCKPSGEVTEDIITKRFGEDFYASARKTKWGDGYIAPDHETVTVNPSDHPEYVDDTESGTETADSESESDQPTKSTKKATSAKMGASKRTVPPKKPSKKAVLRSKQKARQAAQQEMSPESDLI